MNDGRTSLMAKTKSSSDDVVERAGERLLQRAGRSAPRTAGCGRPGSPTAATAIRGCPARRRCPAACRSARRVEALLVDAVAGLVQDAEEGLVEVARVVARGEPAVARADAAAERDARWCRAGRRRSRSRSPPRPPRRRAAAGRPGYSRVRMSRARLLAARRRSRRPAAPARRAARRRSR